MPFKQRAKVGNQIVRKYTYAYSTICPEKGESYSLILPYANTDCMDIFMQGVSDEFRNYRIIIGMDRASWHTGDKVKKWDNIVPLFQPAYSSELNPVENLYQLSSKTPDINHFYFPFSSLKNISIATAMQRFFASIKKNIFKFIYRAFCSTIGIMALYKRKWKV